MAFTTEVQLLLIAAISGLIGICVYTLYLVDGLLSRIESLEEDIQTSKAEDEKFKVDPEKVKSLSVQLGATKEILHSTGRDIDRINTRMESLNSSLLEITRKIGVAGDDASENREMIIMIQNDVSVLSKRLEQMEREATKLIWAQTDEF